jgi:tetratricopeptide (TPR) repeat protein
MGKYGILRVVSGNDQGKQIELNRQLTSIGRGADQMLVIADIAVSRRHIQIHLQPNGYRMQDMGSPNGTMVNGKRVADVQLVDGDQIEVGNSLLRFEHPPSRPQQEMPPPPPAPPPMMAPPPAPPMMAPPAYGQPPMGYPPPGYPPQQAGYMQPQMPMQPMQPQMPMQPMQPQMPQLQAPQPAFPSMVQPLGTGGMAVQPQSQPQSMISGSSIAIMPMGPLGFLGNAKKRTLYFGALLSAFLVGAVGFTVLSLRGSGTAKLVDKALESYNTGTKDFTAAHYDTARKAFEAALLLAPDSQELKHYLEACDTEDKFHKILEQAKKQLDDRKYADALKLFDKVDKSSTQFEDAQQQARQARHEAVKAIYNEAQALAKNDNAAALEKVSQGLEYDPESTDLLELKARLTSAPKPEEPTQVADNTPPEQPEPPKKADKPEPKQQRKSEPKKAEPKKAEPASGGDFSKALAAYKSKDFGGAISAAKAVKSPKAAETARNIEDVKAAIDKAGKLEGSNPKGAIDAYQSAAAADKKLGGGLSGFLSGKISGLQAKAGGGKPAAAGAAADPAKDGQADQMLSQARGLVTKNPSQAKLLCRKVMQLYGNSAKNPKVQEAFKLLNSIKSKGDDDDEF